MGVEPHRPVEQSGGKRLREKLKKLDHFAFEPFPKFSGGEVGSIKGVVATAFVVTVVLTYIGLSTNQFFNDPPLLTQVALPLGGEEVQMVDMAVAVRVQDSHGTPTVFVNEDESILLATARQTVIYKQDRLPRNLSYHRLVPCDVSSWAGYLGTQALCPPVPMYMQGVYAYDVCSSWQIDMVVCDSVAVSYNSSLQCNPDALNIFLKARINFLFRIRTSIGTEYLYTTQYYPAVGLRQIYEQHWRLKHTTVQPNLLTSFRETTIQTLMLDWEKSEVISPLVAWAEVGGQPLLTMFGRLSPLMDIELHQTTTILDLVGKWFSVFGAVASPIAFFIGKYNSKKFFKRYPKWKNVGPDFTPVQEDKGDPDHPLEDGNELALSLLASHHQRGIGNGGQDDGGFAPNTTLYEENHKSRES